MGQWRTPTTGEFLLGTAPGDVPIWNGVEWLPGPGGGGGAIVPLSRTMIVDRTSVAVGPQDGSIAHPFLTIGGAVTAVNLLPPGPASILVGPGTYPEAITIPDRDGFVLQGSGAGTTIIQPPGAAPFGLSYAPAAGSVTRRIDVRDLTVRCTIGQTAIDVASSTFAPLTLLGDGIYFARVDVRTDPAGVAATFVGIGNCYVADCQWASSTALGGAGTEQTKVSNCTTFLTLRSRLGDLGTGWSDTAPVPGSGRSVYQIDDSTEIEARWSMVGHPICAAAPGTVIRGVPAIPITLDATALTNGVTRSPQIFCAAILGNPTAPGTGAVSIIVPSQVAPPGGPAVVLFLRSTHFGTFLASVVGGATRFRLFASQCLFANIAAGSISAGNKLDLDVRGSDYPIGTLAAVGGSDGAIDRTSSVIPFAPLLPGPNAVPIVPPLPPAVAGLYVASFEDGAAVPVAGNVSIPFAGKLAGTFSAVFGGAVPTGGNFTVFRP